MPESAPIAMAAGTICTGTTRGFWGLLPEPIPRDIAVSDWPQFLRGCVRYRESLDRELPHAQRTDEESRAPR